MRGYCFRQWEVPHAIQHQHQIENVYVVGYISICMEIELNQNLYTVEPIPETSELCPQIRYFTQTVHTDLPVC